MSTTPQFSDISVIVQGGISPALTAECLVSIRHLMPDAEIILSSWEGSDTVGLEADHIILSDKPESFLYDDYTKKANNVNFMLRSTLAGLKKATRPYALKIRTDFKLIGTDMLHYLARYEKSDPTYRLFQRKIIACSFFSRDPRTAKTALQYHPSDIAFFGLRDDLINLFDVPHMQKEDEFYTQIQSRYFNRYVPEQHLFINCLKKNNHTIDYDSQIDPNEKHIELTERYFASNFIFLSWSEFGIQAPDKFYELASFSYMSCISYVEWQHLYQKYVDPSFSPPSSDPMKSGILSLSSDLSRCKRMSRYLTLFLPKKLKKKLQARVYAYFVNKKLPSLQSDLRDLL